MNSGIYQIICKATGKRYIGSSVDIKKRKNKHFSQLRSVKHDNKYLQNAFNKYGEDTFEFKILCYYEPKMLVFQEQRFLDYYKTYEKNKGFNILKKADSRLGMPHTKETKKKISLNMCDKSGINNPFFGKKHTKETKDAISEALKGTKNSKETIDKRILSREGYIHSEETKIKMSLSAKRRGISKETREKMILSRKTKIGRV